MSVYVIIAKTIDIQIKNIKLTRWSRNYLGNEHPFRKVNKNIKSPLILSLFFGTFIAEFRVLFSRVVQGFKQDL